MVLLFCCQLISVTVMSYFVKCSFPIISAILPMFLNVSFLEWCSICLGWKNANYKQVNWWVRAPSLLYFLLVLPDTESRNGLFIFLRCIWDYFEKIWSIWNLTSLQSCDGEIVSPLWFCQWKIKCAWWQESFKQICCFHTIKKKAEQN